ncbi:unnamed protein product [Rotaria sordida]|uniref:Fibronectin type-III domain-containing protein n=1 Tax=Rotaria sordida TaxID=392033 RepID=A0A815GJ48_9BILA|nr:unnamed protein product [Rotaria sordida]CAF4004985.1 unnamed protein product [Rotaria sordida]
MFFHHQQNQNGPLEITNATAKDNDENDIEHYVVNKRQARTEKWANVGPPLLGTTCHVKSLEDGKNNEFRLAAENDNVAGLVDEKEYEFRVAVVNRAGPGDFARPPDVASHAIGFSPFNPREIIVRVATKLNPNEVVKVSAATVGFVAPEIFDHDAVEFNRDMWSTGVLSYVIQDNSETMENIRRCDVCFPNEVFAGISDQGKDFIQNLLLKNRYYGDVIDRIDGYVWYLLDNDQINETYVYELYSITDLFKPNGKN